MQKAKKLRQLGTMLSLLVMSMSVLFVSGARTLQAQTSSAVSSQPSPTPVSPADPDSGLRAACAEAVEELKAARKLIAAQDVALGKDFELRVIQEEIEAGLRKLRDLDAQEKAQLWKAVDSANKEISALKAANAVLKKNQVTVWKQIKWFVIGGAAGIIAGTLVRR